MLFWGITAVVIMIIAFIPFLEWIKWINIPLATTGLIVSIVTVSGSNKPNHSGATVGIVCCTLAISLGLLRQIIGAGISKKIKKYSEYILFRGARKG